MNKRIIASLLGVFVLAFMVTATPVLAADVDVNVDGENTHTGADSDNENEYEVDNDLDVNVDNDADLSNEASASVETGDNKQKKNTEAGDVDTGFVDASTDWENVANSGAAFLGAGGGDVEVDGDFINDTTGYKSDNENELEVDNDSDLDLHNMANILNSLGLSADTGDNSQYANTTAGDIDTGGVEVDSKIANEANNDSGLAAGSSLSINVAGTNETTGADSDNENEFMIDNESEVTVHNDADVNSTVEVSANTGGNKQKKNTTAGDIETGGVDVSTDVETSVNNGSSVGSGSGDIDVDGDFTNDTTGADSDNENELEVKNESKTEVNNDADVHNGLSVDANTGDNKQEKNTTGGDVSTGDVSISFDVSNEANSN